MSEERVTREEVERWMHDAKTQEPSYQTQEELLRLGRAYLELEKQRQEEVDEFNAGFDAYYDGKNYEQEPMDIKHDQWGCGYAWAAFHHLRDEVQRLRDQITYMIGMTPEALEAAAADSGLSIDEVFDRATKTVEHYRKNPDKNDYANGVELEYDEV